MLGELIVKIGADLKEFNSKMQEAQAKIQNVSERIKTVGANMSTFITLPILGAGAAAIKYASDTEESLNKVNVAFGESANTIINWSKTSIDSMGMAQGSALDAAALFGDMATSMGIAQVDAANMSTSLVQLGADLASFKNISIDQAMTALNGVFTGETESLKMLGVIMTQTQLESFALSKGIQKNIQDMSEAEMVSLRYAFVLDRTKNSQGDLNETYYSTANQIRVFNETLKEVAATFGREILPVVNDVLKVLNDLLKDFADLTPETKKVIIVVAALAAAIGPLLVGIGSLGLAVAGLSAGIGVIAGLGAAFAALSPVVGLLILTGVGIHQWMKTLEYLRYESDRFAIAFELMGARIKKVFEVIKNELTYTVNNFRIVMNTMIDIASNGFVNVKDSIKTMNKELEDNSALKEYNYLLIDQNANAAEASYHTKMLAHDIDVLGQKFIENASKQKYMTSWDIIRNNVMQQSLDKNAQLIESSKKLNKARGDEMRTSTLESLNKLGSAIETALKSQLAMKEENEIKSANNRIKIEQDINNQWLASNKKILDKWVQEYKTKSDEIVKTKKKELNDIQNAIDAQGNEFIASKQKIIDDLENQTKMEDQLARDQEKQSEINNKQAILSNFDMNKQIAMQNRKALFDQAVIENNANLASEKSIEEANNKKLLLEKKAQIELANQRMIHDFNQRLQSAKGQEDAAKVVADFEYKKQQDAIDNANELVKINEDYKAKLAEIDMKYSDKNKSLIDDYNADIVKISEDLNGEKEKVATDLQKLTAEQQREMLLRQRDAQIKEAQQAIEAARTTTQIVKEDMKTKKELEIEQTIKDYQDAETRLQNEYNQRAAWAEKDNQRIENEYNNKKATIEKKYNELNTAEALQAAAREKLVSGQQTSLINLLKTFYPQWQNAGQSFGEQLLDGLNSKKQSIEKAVSSIMNLIKPAMSATVETKPNTSAGLGATGVFSTPPGVKSISSSEGTPFILKMNDRVMASGVMPRVVDMVGSRVGYS